MLVCDKLLKYLDLKISILIFLAFAIRLSGYYIIRRPFLCLPLETIQFFIYGILYVFITRTAKAIGMLNYFSVRHFQLIIFFFSVPPGLDSTLQGIVYGNTFGLGMYF